MIKGLNNNQRLSKLRRTNQKFVYQKKKYANPFASRRNSRKIKTRTINWRLLFLLGGIIGLLIFLVWFLIFSSFFAINKITVTGTQRIQPQDVEDFAFNQIKTFRQKNILLFNGQKLKDAINQNYSLDDAQVKRKLPKTIIISLKEKTRAAIWHEDSIYFFVDNSGYVVNQINAFSDNIQAGYPLIENNGAAKITDKKIGVNADILKYIININNQFKEKFAKTLIDRFIIGNEENMITLNTVKGPGIYFNSKTDLGQQLNKLYLIINDKLKDDFKNKTYIDLRYGDKVFIH